MQAHEFLSDGVVGKQIVSGLLRLPRCCGPVHLTKLPRGCRGWSGSAKSQVILPMKYTVETGYKISIKSLKRKFGSVIMSAFYCILYYIGWLNFLVHHDHWVAHICWHFALRSWSRQCCSNTWAKRVTYGEIPTECGVWREHPKGRSPAGCSRHTTHEVGIDHTARAYERKY